MKMTTTAGSGGGSAAGGGSIDDEAFARIKMGVNVDIKRSDGKKDTLLARSEFYCDDRTRYLREGL